MDIFESMRIQLSNNLKLLSIQEFIKRRKENIEINPQTFCKLTPNVFQLITYHLFQTLDSEECKKRFMGCFPCLDRKQEGEFRQTTNKWLQEITAKETNCRFQRVVPIYFQHFTPEINVCHLYLDFSNYVLQKQIQRMSSGTQHLIPLNEDSGEAIRKSAEEYQIIRNQIKDETQELTEKMAYFAQNYHKNYQSLKTLRQKKVKILESFGQKHCLSSDTNVEEFIIKAFNQLKSDVNSLKADLLSKNELVDKNWENYLIAFESKNNSLTNPVIDLNEYKVEKFGSFGSTARELINRTKDYDLILKNVLDKDLDTFSDISSEFINEIQNYRKHLEKLRNELKEKFNRLKDLCDKRKAEMLLKPEIIERRKWFEERIPDITKIKFKFEPKRRQTRDKEPIVDLIAKESKENSPKDDSPVYKHRQSLDYSFQVMDISTVHYIPPNPVMDDSLLFSPVENKCKKEFQS